jgi:biotin carboxylase
MKTVLMISPGYPTEMPFFTRGLAEVGARVLGIGDQPAGLLSELTRRSLHDYLRVGNLWDEKAVIKEVAAWVGRHRIDRVECLWEPGVVLAARLREALGVPGLDVDTATAFRNKEIMKQRLDAAGIRTPRHVAVRTIAGCWEAAERIGFPIILKPIAGAGSADTYRVDDADQLRQVLPRLEHVAEVSVEEFVDGEEFTFDTIAIQGKPAYTNIAWYRPRPLVARSTEWISPQVVALRDVEREDLQGGVEMGHAVLKALGFESGFTHMEWYRKADGEVVFGEIGGRPPGAHQVDQMNYACDIDVFRGWGEAVVFGRLSEEIERRYNVANIYKRAKGNGRIHRIDGLEGLRRRWGKGIVWENLLPVGAPRRNWLQTLISDGFLVVRHPDLETTLEMADDVGKNLQIHAA